MTKTINPVIEKILGNAILLGNFEAGSSEWHELRNQPATISGSKIGSILGLSPFKSAFTLWAEKCKLVEPDVVGSLSMRLGQLVEPAIRQLYCEQHPEQTVVEVGTYAKTGFEWAHANPDGIGVDENGEGFVLEIKHSALYWDAVPEHYKAQVFWYCWIFGVRNAVFAVVAGGRYKEFVVEFDAFEFDAILDRVNAFRQNVIDQVKPDWDGSESTFETVRALSPDIEDTSVELGQLGIELFNAHVKVKDAETFLLEMKSRTIDALNGAKYGTIDGTVVAVLSQRAGGKPFLTIKEQK